MNKEFVWTDKLVADFQEWIPKQPHERWVNYSWLIEQFKSSQSTDRGWEIISFKVGGGTYNIEDHLWSLNENGKYSCKSGIEYSLETMLNDKDPIHSVRRLSDNVVFSVGDNCFHGPIVRFNLRNNQITADFECGDVGCSVLLSELPNLLQRTPDSIKLPIGIMPECIWKEQRLYELNQAIIRYINAGLPYPKEWGFERENLISETKTKQ